MADRHEWHGHRLTPLPPGERWLAGGEREIAVPDSAPERPDWNDPWIFDLIDRHIDVAPPPVAKASPSPAVANSRRGIAFLVLLGMAAIITIFVARHRGQAEDPAPLPEPPSSVITSLSRTSHQQVDVHVGDYVKLQLPADHTYSAVVEQPGAASPVIESLDLPGQQPQLRADSPGQAYVEVMQEPACDDPSGCPDQRELLGGFSVSVTP